MDADIHIGILVVLGFTITTALLVVGWMFHVSEDHNTVWITVPAILCGILIGALMRMSNKK
jgi:hypothetical protein